MYAPSPVRDVVTGQSDASGTWGAGDADNAAVSITHDQLRVIGECDYATQASYQIRVRATDAQGFWCEAPFTLTGHANSVLSVAFSPDGVTLASGSSDKTIILWQVSDGVVLRTLSGHTSSVWTVAFSPNGQTLASGGSDSSIKLWQAGDGTELRTLSGHAASVQAVAFSPDGLTLASASTDQTLKLWQVSTGTLQRTLTGHTATVSAVTYLSDGLTLVSGSADSTLKFWRAGDGTLTRTVNGQTSTVNGVAYSPDGQLIAAGTLEGGVMLWRASDGALLRTLTGHTAAVNAVAFSPDGSTLASASADKSVKLWQTSDGTLVRTLTGYTASVFAVAFSPDGQCLADSSIRLWRVSDGTLVRSIPDGAGRAVTFSPDGQTLASGTTNTVKLWRVSDGTLVRSHTGHATAVLSVVFSPDGQTLASSSSDATIKVWQVSDGALQRTLAGHTGTVYAVAFSPDGQSVASGSTDTTLKLWQVSDGTQLDSTPAGVAIVRGLAFAPDGAGLAAGGGGVCAWGLSAAPDTAAKLAFRGQPGTVPADAILTPPVTVAVQDAAGNLVAGATPTITLTALPAAGGAPVAVGQVAATGGIATFASVALALPGSYTLLAAAAPLTAAHSTPFTVTPVASRLAFTVQPTAAYVDGLISPVTVAVQDRFGNAVTNYAGIVTLSALPQPAGTPLALGTAPVTNGLAHFSTLKVSALGSYTLKAEMTSLTPAVSQVFVTTPCPTYLQSPARWYHSRITGKVAYSPVGSLLAAAQTDGSIALLNPVDGTLIRTINSLRSGVACLSFSADGQWLAAGGWKTINLWRVSDGMLLRTFTVPEAVNCVAFSPDGSTLAAGSGSENEFTYGRQDSTVRLWQMSDGMLRHTLTGLATFNRSVAFSPDGQTLVVGGERLDAGWHRTGTLQLWRVSDGALLRTLPPQAQCVNGVAYQPDGLAVVSASIDGYINFWQVSDGTLLRQFTAGGRTKALAVSADGQHLAAGSESRIKLWRMSDGTLMQTLTGGTNFVSALAFSPNGQFLAAGNDDFSLTLWQTSDGTLQRTLTGYKSVVASVAVSPDGQTVASASGDGTITFWRADDGTQLRGIDTFRDNPYPMDDSYEAFRSIAFTPDGQTLISGSSYYLIKLWRVSDATLLRTISGTGYVSGVAVSPDGQTLASIEFKYDANRNAYYFIHLWRASDGLLLRTLDGGRGFGNAVAFSPDSQTLATGAGWYENQSKGEGKLWRVSDGALLQTLAEPKGQVFAVAFSPDGRTLATASGNGDNAIRLWRVTDGAPTRTLVGPTGAVMAVAFTLDGQALFAGSEDHTISSWRTSDGAALSRTLGEVGRISALAVLPDGASLVVGGFGGIKRWRLTAIPPPTARLAFTRQPTTIVVGSPMIPSVQVAVQTADGFLVPTATAAVTLTALSTTGTPVALGTVAAVNGVADFPALTLPTAGRYTLQAESGTLTPATSNAFFAVATGLAAFQQPAQWHRSGYAGLVAYAPVGSLLAATQFDHTITLIDPADGTVRHTLAGHTAAITALAFSADGATLVTGSADQSVKRWRVADGALLRTFTGHATAIRTVAVSPDGLTLASGDAAGAVKFWRMGDGTLRRTLAAHTGGVGALAFKPNGLTLASGGADAAIKLWKLSDGTPQGTLTAAGGITAVAFSPDGQTLAAGGGSDDIGDFVKIWDAGDLTEQALLQTGNALAVTALAFSPDGQTIATGEDWGYINGWSVADGLLRYTLSGADYSPVLAVSFSADGTTLAAGGAPNSLHLYQASDGAFLRALTGHTPGVAAVAYASNGLSLASGSPAGTARLTQSDDGAVLRTIPAGATSSVAVSPDGLLLATGGANAIVTLWQAGDGAYLQALTAHTAPVTAVAFSPDGQSLASGSTDQTLALWSRTGVLLQSFNGFDSAVTAIAFTPDGQALFVGCADGTLQLMDLNNTLLRTWAGHAGGVHAVAVCLDGQTLASGGADGTIKLWTVSDGTLLRTLTATAAVTGVAFSPDRRLLLAGCTDGTLSLWRVSDGAGLDSTNGLVQAVSAVAVAPDGASIVVSGAGGLTRFDLCAAPATQLAFTVQPSATLTGAVIYPAVTVAIHNADGAIVPTATHAVTLTALPTSATPVLLGTVTAVNGVATFSTLSLATAGSYTLQANADGLTSATSAAFTVTSPVPAETIVDNLDAARMTFTGRWFASATAPGFYGTNYHYDDTTQKGTTSARFTPAIPGSGWYTVALRWRNSHSSLASAVPVTVTHRDGTSAVTVNQQQGGGTWVPLGVYYFTAGTGGSVLLGTTGTTGYVIADAVRFTPAPPLQVTAPNGGERWFTGSAQTIRWRAYDLAGNVKVELLRDGAAVQTLAASVPATQEAAAVTLPTDYTGTTFTVRVSSLATPSVEDASDAAFTLVAAGPAEVIVDNGDTTGVTITGRWTPSTAAPGYVGTNYLYDDPTQRGTSSVRFTPAVPAAGLYQVFLRWRASMSSLASNVPVDIVHGAGTSTVAVNQRVGGGTWVSVGIFSFAAGTGGSVTIRTAGVNGTVIADAVRLLPASRADIILDNTATAGVTLTGRWFASATAPGFYGTNYLYDDPAQRGTSSARFAPTLPVAATYAVYLRWRESAATLASNVPLTIAHSGGTLTRTLNQRVNGGGWVLLGLWDFPAGTTGAVTLGTTGVNGYVIADAVRFVQVTNEIILDNAAPAGVTFTGRWFPSAGTPGFYGTNYHYDDPAQKATSTARFTPALPAAGSYALYLRWRNSATSLSAAVPVTVTHGGGTTALTVNQQVDGGTWVYLGTFPFAAGSTGSVLLSAAGTTGYVIADAVRWCQVE